MPCSTVQAPHTCCVSHLALFLMLWCMPDTVRHTYLHTAVYYRDNEVCVVMAHLQLWS